MNMKHVAGENKGNIVIYTLSTCGWCKKAKAFLNELGVEYYYADVDLIGGSEKNEVLEAVKKHNPKCSFPTLVFNDNSCVVGFDEQRIREALKP